ncbi:tRNA (adenosine(37)-N6)-threonylcarbamoyltransferase complex dimerization subunit type 1 TsaB [Idiomarina tyrosinivorans]|uniref:tRNA threonylcarbamoyladenosine biosynthesis protein TsaB n=1 Tax=Idiomarina tyrosinivorans TaxID=1445662 RepID=A0A432ZL68_9GAMM|nr:tRNA (adenosine(37)-N6)-threonylcarbamoyltransferase complex dimerization subunit type 1 TsaB [Idiomarina tyrosinivorans]RUO78747.1 tRNA (adenosine(37)-N6)-threonylcarbamoyltransferase complex dimerization subunit type 1 TsaB [Idiomarina tyrosinivorans]
MSCYLAIDTSTENCSVALLANGNVYSRTSESPRTHSQKVLGYIDELLEQAQISRKAIQGIAVAVGPGSFTGVRIGLAIAQGLGFSLGLKLLPVSTLTLLAQQALKDGSAKAIAAAIDARMSEVYCASYVVEQGRLREFQGAQVMAPSDACFAELLANVDADIEAVGTGWDNYAAALDPQQKIHQSTAYRLPLAADLLDFIEHATAEQWQAPEHVEPFYVRNEVTWQKLPGR